MALRIALLTGLTALASSHRLQDSGSIDSGFNIGTGFNNTVQALAVTSDGSGDVYAAGSFSTYNGSGAGRIIRINPDGSVDGSFDVGSGFSGLGNVVMALALALDGSGDVYAGGAFTGYNGAAANWIARLNANGSIDSGFNAGAGFDDNPWSLVVATDGSGDVYVAGYFSTYGGDRKSVV